MRQRAAWRHALLALLLAAACACAKVDSKAGAVARPNAPAPAQSLAAARSEAAPQATSARHVAVRQFLAVEVDAGEVETVLKDATQRCAPPQCELLESSLAREERGAPARAHLRLRIAPASAQGFLDELARRGDVIERRTDTEDRTGEVIDVEARIRNMAELRDRLRGLLGRPGATVKDLVEVESQLARVQADLDAATGRRKALAEETEKVTITADIRARRTLAEAGAMEPIRQSLRELGHTFAHSLAGLISFIVVVVPWIALLVAAIWSWRRWRRPRRKP